MEHGSLESYLQKHSNDVTQFKKIRFVVGITEGLVYLATRGFVHRDIATRNVLLNSELTPKVSDFGMSRNTTASNNYYRSKGGIVPL